MRIVINEIKELLDLFQKRVPDEESNRLVQSFCIEEQKWLEAFDLFTTIRHRNLQAISEKNVLKQCQYYFEEVCVQTLFNMTRPDTPFDPDSPYWIIKNALRLAQEIGIPVAEVVKIVTPTKTLEQPVSRF